MLKPGDREHGHYVDVEMAEDGSLLLSLTADGKDAQEGLLERHARLGEDALRGELLEDFTEGCWAWVDPEAIWALFSGPILTDEVDWPDDIDLPRPTGNVWYDGDYAVYSMVEELLREGETRLDYLQPKEVPQHAP